MVFSPPGKGATETLFLDVGRWPPRIERLGEYVDSIDRSRGGRWVMLTQFPERVPIGEHNIWSHEVRLRDDPFAEAFTALACGGPRPELGVVGVGFLGERVVADPFGGSRRIGRLPLLQRGELLVPARGAPPVDRIIELSVVRLGDGSEVLVWDTGGYELRGGRFIRTFDLGPKPGRSPIPAGDDGFYYLAHGKLFEARRGRPPRRHAPWLGHINSLAAGPAGSLLLHEYYTRNKELGEIYFPEDGSFARLELAHIKEEEPENFESLHWLPGSDRLLVAAETRLWSLPGEFIRSLPRRAGRSAGEP